MVNITVDVFVVSKIDATVLVDRLAGYDATMAPATGKMDRLARYGLQGWHVKVRVPQESRSAVLVVIKTCLEDIGILGYLICVCVAE